MTDEGKAQRWEIYQAKGGAKPYDQWQAIYYYSIRNSRQGGRAADAYQATLGWGQREVTVDAGGDVRRLDIADAFSQPPKAVEVKNVQKLTGTQDIDWEVERDAALVRQGWQITWVYTGSISEPLRYDLALAGIRYVKVTIP